MLPRNEALQFEVLQSIETYLDRAQQLDTSETERKQNAEDIPWDAANAYLENVIWNVTKIGGPNDYDFEYDKDNPPWGKGSLLGEMYNKAKPSLSTDV